MADERTEINAQHGFPFPGERVLSLWVAEEVKHQLYLRASTEGILSVVRQVLDDHDKRYGPRPVGPTAELA
jgi:hypothetical protein